METSHYTFAQAAEQIIKHKLGYHHETDSDAAHAALKRMSANGGGEVALAILEKLCEMSEGADIPAQIRFANRLFQLSVNGFAAFREHHANKGPLPSSVWHWYSVQFDSLAIRSLLPFTSTGRLRALNIYECRLPPKGSAIRREYDKWMRGKRKPRVKKDAN